MSAGSYRRGAMNRPPRLLLAGVLVGGALLCALPLAAQESPVDWVAADSTPALTLAEVDWARPFPLTRDYRPFTSKR